MRVARDDALCVREPVSAMTFEPCAVTSVSRGAASRAFARLVSIATLSGWATFSSAANWTVTPRLSLSEVYSDNIDLAPSDQATHDFVTQISPGVSLRGDGGRVDVALDYTLQGLVYARDTSADEINHELDANANVIVVPNLAFLDLGSTLRQENVSGRGRVTDSNITASDNRDTVYTVSIAPSLQHRFEDVLDAQARYTFQQVGSFGSSGDTTTDNDGADVHTLQAALRSGTRFDRLPTSLTYNFSREDNDDGGENTLQLVEMQSRYRFSRTWGLIAGVGYEDNDFGSADGGGVNAESGNEDGFVWTAGATYAPNNRLSAEAGLTHRFFGTSFFLDLTAVSRRTAVSLRYGEALTTSSRRLLDRALVANEDAFGEEVETPDLDDAFRVPTDSLNRSSDVLVSRRFDGSVVFSAARTTLNVAGFYDRREFETGNQGDEDIYGASIGVSRRVSPRFTAGVDANWQRSEFKDDNTNQDFWSVGLAFSRQFGRSLFANLELRHSEQQGSDAADDYKENRATLGMRYVF